MPEVQNQGVKRAAPPQRLQWKILPCLFQLLMAPGVVGLWLPKSNLCLLHMDFSPFPCVFSCLSLIRTLVIQFRIHPDSSGLYHPEILNLIISAKTPFPNKSQSQFPGIKTCTYHLVGYYWPTISFQCGACPSFLSNQPAWKLEKLSWY